MIVAPLQDEAVKSLPPRSIGVGLKITSAIWLLLTVAGMLRLNQYASTTAPQCAAVAEWPVDATISKQAGRPELLVFLHPKCACSVATVRQLATIHSQCMANIDITAIFYCPQGETTDWAHSRLWEQCLRIPGVLSVVDRGGKHAAEFGVTTSGHLLLFDRSGRRLFGGGITTARAHEGHGFGAEALRQLLRGETPQEVTFPVFGCPIRAGQPEENVATRINND